MKDHDAPPPAKKIHDNSQRISPTLKKFVFYRKKDASEYIITDEEFQFVLKYDGDPIVPPTSEEFLKEKEFQHDYNENLEQMRLMDKNCGEYAHRIWKWWTARVRHFPCHALALRLVVLTQMPSCLVEHVFSRLQLIQERCGNKLYEDMTER